jgi:glucosamine--fructose-6-phosphate aminotransferase (isomerizing)
MCGIFGVVSANPIELDFFARLGKLSERRGKDSSGAVYLDNNSYRAVRADKQFSHLMSDLHIPRSAVAIGHSRLITNGQADNQPVVRDDIAIVHNGIITNDDEYWRVSEQKRLFVIDTEAILGVAVRIIEQNITIDQLFYEVRKSLKGSFSCAVLLPCLGKLVLMSNTGSLHIGENVDGSTCFASEHFFLEELGCSNIRNLLGQLVLDVPSSTAQIFINDYKVSRPDLIPALGSRTQEEKKLIFPEPKLRRCTRCILPETMPFISFDTAGVCNYCTHHRSRNSPKPRSVLEDLLKRYQSVGDGRCIMPFSGGRDSSFALHLITKEFGIRPITMTYDWGMVTDLARRNISLMCGELGVENILIADDISKKRRNIRLNLQAWLKKPDLGMINILMAGDKHFFRHIETVKRETDISLNIWGMNPLEVTHFKAGFLGFPPDFATKQVFYTGLSGQIRYQSLRAKAMINNPSYINRSLWDTLSGEYFRSVKEKTDFYNLFDFWRWDESEIDTAIASYGWEKAADTNSTWRIGDGTAAFYNYVYYTLAGFTEYDTFRSNQIREGQITRENALELVAEENRPRYQNIKWYLDAIGMEFAEVINVINKAPRVYQ